MRVYLWVFNGVIVFLALASIACQAGNDLGKKTIALPDLLLGTWQVSKVYIDTGESRWNTTRDDKFNVYEFLGRIISISKKEITINTPYDEPCLDSEVSIIKSTAGKIIAKSITTRFQMGTVPTVQDMQLTLDNDTPVEVLYLLCQGKPISTYRGNNVEDDWSNAVWVIKMANDKLLMSWHNETILLLTPVTRSTKPVASFSCAKAMTVVEKTICDSVGLAAYDQSVTKTYKYILSYYRSKTNAKPNVATLKKEQREWLKKRDGCGDDVKCLEKSMAERISNMDYDLGMYIYKNRR